MCTKWWVRSALKKVFMSQSFSLKNRCTSLNILNILSIFFCFGIFLQCTSTVYGSKSYQKERETGRLRRTVKVNICVGQCTMYNAALTRAELIFFSSWNKWFKNDILVSIQRYSIFLNIVCLRKWKRIVTINIKDTGQKKWSGLKGNYAAVLTFSVTSYNARSI